MNLSNFLLNLMWPLGFIQVQTPRAKRGWITNSCEDCTTRSLKSTHLLQDWVESCLPLAFSFPREWGVSQEEEGGQREFRKRWTSLVHRRHNRPPQIPLPAALDWPVLWSLAARHCVSWRVIVNLQLRLRASIQLMLSAFCFQYNYVLLRKYSKHPLNVKMG